jgi:hypothetical protein
VQFVQLDEEFRTKQQKLYSRELFRVSDNFTSLVHLAEQEGQLSQVFEPDLAAQIQALANELGELTAISNERVKTIGSHIEQLLARVGFTGLI